MISPNVERQAFVVRHLPCKAVVAISMIEPRASRDLFETYGGHPLYEIDIAPAEEARLVWGRCKCNLSPS